MEREEIKVNHLATQKKRERHSYRMLKLRNAEWTMVTPL